VGRKREEEAEKSESVVGYIALCEDKWRLLTTQAFNNIGLLNNIHGLVQRLYTYCSNTNESWKESDKVRSRETGAMNRWNEKRDSTAQSIPANGRVFARVASVEREREAVGV